MGFKVEGIFILGSKVSLCRISFSSTPRSTCLVIVPYLVLAHFEAQPQEKMRESYRTCMDNTRRKMALNASIFSCLGVKGLEEFEDSVDSIVKRVATGEFDGTAVVLSDGDRLVEFVKAATTKNKVMLLDLGSALGVKTREHFYGSPDVLCLGLNPKEKIRPKDGAKAGDFDTELSWAASASECAFLAALFRVVLPAGYHFDPDLVVVAVDGNSPQVSGQLVHQVQV